MIELLSLFLPVFIFVFALGVLICGIHWLLIGRHIDLGNEGKFGRQLILLGLTLLGLLVVILILPIAESSRNKLLGLIGIIFSGMLAFSSTTILSNLAAGVLLRITKPFRTGDFIRIGDFMGRVSERGLFDTEIQTETRELVALPNIYCINNPVTTIRSSGTIISASLSLGYDVDHTQVESLLIEAAGKGGLEEPFVHILELGNFSVTYRVSGFLSEPKFLISARSKLYGSVLDTLHAHKIEIMSPTYMNQRKLGEGYKAMPETLIKPAVDVDVGAVETMAFDKAEQAEQLENEKRRLMNEIDESERARKQIENETEKVLIDKRIEEAREQLQEIEKATEVFKSK